MSRGRTNDGRTKRTRNGKERDFPPPSSTSVPKSPPSMNGEQPAAPWERKSVCLFFLNHCTRPSPWYLFSSLNSTVCSVPACVDSATQCNTCSRWGGPNKKDEEESRKSRRHRENTGADCGGGLRNVFCGRAAYFTTMFAAAAENGTFLASGRGGWVLPAARAGSGESTVRRSLCAVQIPLRKFPPPLRPPRQIWHPTKDARSERGYMYVVTT